jgi:hypothetical protein
VLTSKTVHPTRSGRISNCIALPPSTRRDRNQLPGERVEDGDRRGRASCTGNNARKAKMREVGLRCG